MENLNMDGARLMRGNLSGQLTERQRQDVKIWLCKLQFNPEVWGISVHLPSSVEPSEILQKLEPEQRDNARFFDASSKLIEVSQAA